MFLSKAPPFPSVHLLTLICAGMLSACAVGPDFKQPAAPKTSSYTEGPLSKKLTTAPGVPGGTDQEFVEGADIEAQWWELYKSPELDALIKKALEQNPNLGAYFHIPLLIFGEPLKKEFRGQKIETLGSQADIVRTLLYQMNGDFEKYTWSKDLLNPACPQFALHTINRGFGWISENGNFSYHMDAKNYPDNTMNNSALKKEQKRCHSFMSLVYNEYKNL